jgi:(S)-2-hydroxy-acid oxidase
MSIKYYRTVRSPSVVGQVKNSDGMNQAAGGSALAKYVASLIDQSLSWKDIAWLRKNTTMKIVVKGVMTVEDAVESVRQGVDAIWVSNHGT